MWKRILGFVMLFSLAFTGCMPSRAANSDPTQVDTNDDARIYAAAIREIHAYERTRGLVYVVTTTEDYKIYDAPTASSQYLQLDLQQAVSAELADEPYKVIWIEDFDDAPFSPVNWKDAMGWKIAEGDGLIITFGNIHPQEDGSVQLSFFMTCADMCGIGKNFVLNQVNGHWSVTGSIGPEIAS